MLGQLTTTGKMDKDKFVQRFKEMKASGSYYVIVFENVATRRIVGAGTVMIEKKFIHNCGSVGHIEDIVVDSSTRGKKLGKKIIEQLKHICSEVGAYKVILDCGEHNVGFYEKCGMTKKEVQMVTYFEGKKTPSSKL